MTGKLEGKVAVVTGGSAGIGLAAAKRFAEEGAFVFITGRRQVELDAAVKEIGRSAAAVRADAASTADLARLFETVRAAKGRIDVLYANAGIYEFTPFGSITEEAYDKMFNVNVKGVLFTVQQAVPLMADGGSIILTGSVAGSKGFEAGTVYGATDEFGARAIENKVHVHDLHATILWLLGFVSGYTMGGLIHILLVVAIIIVLVRVISGEKP